MAEETIKITTVVDGGSSKKTLGDLRKEVNGYKSDLLNLTRGSKEYNEVLKQQANAQGQLNAINTDLKASTQNLTDVYGQITNVATGVVGGFNSLLAVSTLLGDENEALAETFVKLQAGITLIQGLKSLSTGIKAANLAFKAFNVTLYANPLGAFVLAAAAAIAIIVSLIAVLNNNSKAQAQLNKEVEQYNRDIKQTQEQNNLLIDVLKKQGIEESTLLALRKQNLQAEIALTQAIVNKYNQAGKLSKQQKKDLEEVNKLLKEQRDAIADIEKAENQIAINRKIDERTNIQNLNQEIELLRAQGVSEERINKIRREAIERNIELAQAEIARLETIDFLTTREEEYLVILKGSLTQQLAALKELEKDERGILLQGIRDRKAASDKAAADRKNATEKANKELLESEKAYQRQLLQVEKDSLTRFNELQKSLTQDEGRVSFIQSEIADNNRLQAEIRSSIFANEELKKSIEAIPASERTDAQIRELTTANNALVESYGKLTEAQQNNDALNQELKQEQETLKENQKEYNLLLEERTLIEEEIQRQAERRNLNTYEQIESDIAAIESEKNRNDARILAIQEELDAEELSYEKRIALLDEYNSALLQSSSYEKQIADTKKKLEQEKQKATEATLKVTSDVLSSASKLLGEETAAGKATAVAAATIDTYKAATGAYASLASIPIVGPGLGIAAAAAAVLSGAANVKSILATKVPGASDSASGEIPSLPDFPEAETPIQETHNNLDAYDEEFLNSSRPVLVREDYQIVDSRVKVAESNATF